MIHRDYIPGTTKDFTPKAPTGFDYWESHWRLEKDANGKTVLIKDKPVEKEVSAEVVTEKAEAKKEPSFSCNTCEFVSDSESGMKRHVTVAHDKKRKE